MSAKAVAIKSVETLKLSVDAYFDDCDREKRPYTVSGLASALGMTRIELLNYEGKKALLKEVKLALGRCEAYAEESLYTGKATGASFSLKNNFPGWKDKADLKQDQYSDLELKLAEAEERIRAHEGKESRESAG